MNRRLILRLQGAILLLEAATMAPSLFVAYYFGDGDAPAFLKTIGILCVCGFPMWRFAKPPQQNLRAREGLVSVALSWILLSAFGALPFVFGGMIPNFFDAFFESVSGFTTTGASIMQQMEGQPHGLMFWRSFTHWIGGMGVLVLTLALLPQMSGRTSHLVRAESPGPSLSKLVPKMGDMARILYLMYGALTFVEVLCLLLAGMNPYDALIHAFGTAGTGGFSNYGTSVGHFQSPAVDVIITVFMVLFGVNFAVYYRMLGRHWRDVAKNEELRWYLFFFATAVLALTVILMPKFGNLGQALRHGAFQAASIMSTTGFSTQDFNLWPQAAKIILVLLMFIGSCAGSTAGGLKVVRVALLCKMGRREVRHAFQPRKTQVVRFEGKGVEESMLSQVAIYFFLYVALMLAGTFVIALENHGDFETNLTAAITCISNVGPGLGAVGPLGNFSLYNSFSKTVLSLLMLVGRLELFPMLVLFNPCVWKRQ